MKSRVASVFALRDYDETSRELNYDKKIIMNHEGHEGNKKNRQDDRIFLGWVLYETTNLAIVMARLNDNELLRKEKLFFCWWI